MYEEEINTLVLDVGSYMCRAGFAGVSIFFELKKIDVQNLSKHEIL